MMDPMEIPTHPPLPQTPRPIVLIGAGGIVNDAHLPAYRKAGFPVAGIVDLDRSQAQKTATAFAIPHVYGSVAEAIDQAPAGAIFDVAVPAAAILDILPQMPDGAGVLIQKPMGENLAEAAAIRDLCRAKRLHAAINFQLRYAPFVLAARHLIDQGVIGELYDMEVRVTVYTPWHLWGFLERVDCMEVKYHSIHYLDLMRAFLGDPAGIYAQVFKHPQTPNLDGACSSMILDYGDRVRATITTNHFHQYGLAQQESYIKWEGSKGAIKATMGLLMDYPHGLPDRFEYCTLSAEGASPWQRVDIDGSWFPDAFIGTMASVMRRAEGSADDLPTAVDDAYRTMALVEAACRSSRAGGHPIPD